MNDSARPPSTTEPQSFVESSPVLPVVIDTRTGANRWVGGSDPAPFGLQREAWLTEEFWARAVRPGDLDDLLASRARAASDGARIDLDYQLVRPDGRTVWINEVGSGVEGTDGSTELRCYLIDITDRKRQELALWRDEARLRALFQKSPDALLLTDPKGRVLNMNDQAEALFGYSLSEIAGSSIEHLLDGAGGFQLAALIEAFDRDPARRSIIDGRVVSIERSDGTNVPVEISRSLIVTGEGERQLLCSVRDLTARRRVEAQLRSSRRHLRQIANALPAMVCFLDTAHRFLFVNDAYAAAAGLERPQVEGLTVAEVFGPRLHEQLEPALDAASQGTASHVRSDVPLTSGTVPADITLVPHHDESNRVSGYFLVILDLSAEVAAREADRRHRAEIAHVNRVATLGELAASIAHELNQPLSSIVTNARAARRLMAADPPDLAEAGDALDDIAASSLRAGEVIESMRDLLERGERRHDPVDISAMVREVLGLLHSEAVGRGVVLRTEDPEDGKSHPFVSGDVIQLKQVLINLVVNAIEAVASSDVVDKVVSVEIDSDGDSLRLRVIDAGPGLPTSDPEEVFRPFYSGREGGLGMGLAISRTIAAAHRGTLRARDGDGGGAVFTLELPRG